MDKLHRKDPSVHSFLRQQPVKHTTPVSLSAWQEHLSKVFVRSTSSYSSLRAHTVPSLNGHHQSQDDAPFSDGFPLPDESQIRKIVALHISRLNGSSSPGFDSILPAFLKYACTVVRHDDGRAFRQTNVLTPIISTFFHLLFIKASIPSEWKTAKLTPLYKKGSIAHASNYRMLAVSGTFYRLYTNVLRTLLQDWCEQTHSIPDSQFGFLPRAQYSSPTLYSSSFEECCTSSSTTSLSSSVCCLY